VSTIRLTRVPCSMCSDKNSSMGFVTRADDGVLWFQTVRKVSRSAELRQIGFSLELGSRGAWASEGMSWPISADMPATLATVSCRARGHKMNVDLRLLARNAASRVVTTTPEPTHPEVEECAAKHRHVRFVVDLPTIRSSDS